MIKLDTLKKKLESAGLDVENIRLTDGAGGSRPALRVNHDYTGKYPDAETWKKREAAAKIARRAGYKEEARGFYSATFIY